MSLATPRRPGRPAAASRADALRLARSSFLRGERIDVGAIARELGLARATMHRWFGTRDGLVGEVLSGLAEERLGAIRAQTRGRGARALLACFDRYNRELAASQPLRSWLESEQERALKLLTSSAGPVQPRVVACVERLISAEIESGAFSSQVAAPTLAYAIVRLAESFLYNDAMFGIRGDIERLHQVEAALLGVG
jgi:AcrR family transcriptional regulator